MTPPTATGSRRRAAAEPEVELLTVTNPATGEVAGEVPIADADAVAAAVARARGAQPAWQALGCDGRAHVLDAFRQRLSKHADLVLDVLCAEAGKPREDAQADLTLVVSWAKYWADHAGDLLRDETVTSFSPFVIGRRNVIVRDPVGVVGVIGPWNVPLTLTVGDALPALMAGNAVVIKPSETTPLSADFVAKLWLEAGGPVDVLQVVHGRGETGGALVDEVDYVMFTGSVATGKKVAARAIETLTPYSLELGGKDAMIVCADANLERAANAAAYYGLFNAGQICMSVERIYVEEAVYDEFVDRLVDTVSTLRQGQAGGVGQVDLGAVIHPPQRTIVQAHVDDALAKGARALTGAAATPDMGPGDFFPPTVLVDVDHTMDCMTEETFGPTLPVMKVADVDEAVRLANDSPYGLTARVWTSELDRGEAIARRVDAGTVSINDALTHLAAADLPFGGWKSSGMGSRNGPDGIRKYTRTKVVQVNRLSLGRDVHWFPYKSSTSNVLAKATGVLYGRPALRVTSSAPVTAVKNIVGRIRGS